MAVKLIVGGSIIVVAAGWTLSGIFLTISCSMNNTEIHPFTFDWKIDTKN